MFDFRLQSVLNYKKQAEEKLMLGFAHTKAHLYREKEILKKLKTQRVDMISHLGNMGALPMPASDVSAYLSYIHYMRDEENRQQEIVCKVEKELEEERIKLIGASRNRRVLEIIKEKKLKEYKLSLIAREQKELDEAGILRV
jgi:flagellar protein FliJ